MSMREIEVTEFHPAWKTLLDIAETVSTESWLLVGGLMTQAHALLAGVSSRATKDVDLLIDVMSRRENARLVVAGLRELGFSTQESGFRNGVFHRMTQGEMVVDILVADHLPKYSERYATVHRQRILEAPGGAQAIERKIEVVVTSEKRRSIVCIPNLLGALIIKCAAYAADDRDRERHLDDIALLTSLVEDHKAMREALHGSDRKRLRAASLALADPSHPAWLNLSAERRVAGQDTLRILLA